MRFLRQRILSRVHPNLARFFSQITMPVTESMVITSPSSVGAHRENPSEPESIMCAVTRLPVVSGDRERRVTLR